MKAIIGIKRVENVEYIFFKKKDKKKEREENLRT